MKCLTRQFADNRAKIQFLKGMEKAIGKSCLSTIKLIRISYIREGNWGFIITSTWGKQNKKPIIIDKQFFESSIDQLSDMNWFTIGQNSAEKIISYTVDNQEFETLERKADAQNMDVWKTSEFTELANDVVDDLEIKYGAYINGKLHWRVKAALINMVSSLENRVKEETLQEIIDKNRAKASMKKELIHGNN